MGDYEDHKFDFKLALTREHAEELLEQLETCRDDGEVQSVTMKIDPEVADYGIRQLERQLKSLYISEYED